MKRGAYKAAVEAYTAAIDLWMENEDRAVLYSNRAAARLKMPGEATKALSDAERACALHPTYAKAHFRRGQALRALKKDIPAAHAMTRCLRCARMPARWRSRTLPTVEIGWRHRRRRRAAAAGAAAAASGTASCRTAAAAGLARPPGRLRPRRPQRRNRRGAAGDETGRGARPPRRQAREPAAPAAQPRRRPTILSPRNGERRRRARGRRVPPGSPGYLLLQTGPRAAPEPDDPTLAAAGPPMGADRRRARGTPPCSTRDRRRQPQSLRPRPAAARAPPRPDRRRGG